MVNAALDLGAENLTEVKGAERPVLLTEEFRAALSENLKGYLGVGPGGHNLLKVARDMDLVPVANFSNAIAQCKENGGRVFFCGNGGSYDNARALAEFVTDLGVKSETLDIPEENLKTTLTRGYKAIFAAGVEKKNVGPNDIVVGISGSGTSANILEALNAARTKEAQVFCLGGRGGGKMLGITGAENAMIATTESMECLEDINLLVGVVLTRAGFGANFDQIKAAHESVLETLEKYLAPSNVIVIDEIADQLIQNIQTRAEGNKADIYVAGSSIGATHIRADWERGITNNCPIAGVGAPEFHSTNAWMATLNDDGTDFALVHGLQKRVPGKSDFALIIHDTPQRPEVAMQLKELLESSETPYIEIGGEAAGEGRLDTSMWREGETNMALSILGHVCSDAGRKSLWSVFEVVQTEIDISSRLKDGNRQPGMKDTLEFEAEMRGEGKLGENRVYTIAYGTVFEAMDPRLFNMRRAFY